MHVCVCVRACMRVCVPVRIVVLVRASCHITHTHTHSEGHILCKVKGDRVLVYLGIIDILQSYRLKKKLEHTMKSMIADGVCGVGVN